MNRDQRRSFRYEVRSEAAGRPARMVSRHHSRRTAERRLLRLPIDPGETVTILEDGEAIRVCRCPGWDEPGIPF